MLDKTSTATLAAADLAVSQAQDAARNKFATSHVNAAHARLIEAVIRNLPPAFDLHPTSEQFVDAKDFLGNIAAAFDNLIYDVMAEANINSPTRISTMDRITIVSDALHDADVFADLNIAADDLREAEAGRSDYAEHNTHHHTLSGVE